MITPVENPAASTAETGDAAVGGYQNLITHFTADTTLHGLKNVADTSFPKPRRWAISYSIVLNTLCYTKCQCESTLNIYIR